MMKDIDLGIIETLDFENSLILSISKKWNSFLKNPVVFEAKIEKNRLVLSANLGSLDRAKGVDTNER